MSNDIIELKDHGEETVKCESCGRPIMHYRIWAVSDMKTNIVATCPFCNETTPPITIVGQFYYGPIGEDENFKSTIITDVEYEKDRVIFKVGI